MRNYVNIRFVKVPKESDGAGGFVEETEVTLYETYAAVKNISSSRTVDALASEVNYGVRFEVYLPSNLTVGTETPVYVGNIRHDIISVVPSDYTPIRYTITTVRREQ